MGLLLLIGLVAGVVAGISPCILPVLPVVLVAGATTPEQSDSETAGEPAAGRRRRGLGRPLAVVGGLVLSFSALILAGSEVISFLHLPQDLIRDVGIVLLGLVGLSLVVRPLSALLERPFSRLRAPTPSGAAGGFVLGLALGVVYVPCAGPILAAITVVGATHHVGLEALGLTLAFGVGTALPLLLVAFAGRELAGRVKALRLRAPAVRGAGGVVLIAMAVAIALNLFAGLQREVPGYTSALQSRIEGGSQVRKDLGHLTGGSASSLANCNSSATGLVDCGPAPAFKGITAWLNTPGGKPLTIASLRGKVVLIDFWTYSCINCQRTLPHVEAWYREYAKYGFVVVGVHTPEFAFEHVVSNVRSQAAALGVHYPIAVDDDYDTWNAYDNEYWPAEYLVDAGGDVRHVHFAEGDYSLTESLIRQLLLDAHPGVVLPPATDLPDLTPTGELSPETYLGYERVQYLYPDDQVANDSPYTYQFPKGGIPLGAFGLSGVWTDHSQEATAGARAELELAFVAEDVYLVLGGSGTVKVSVGGDHVQTIAVSGVPRLYTLFHASSSDSALLLLQVTPGVQAYDFTFG
jgi:cytochrome c biogenesis protein CcdA/thiol-disulfide isomerase/thioredoxin